MQPVDGSAVQQVVNLRPGQAFSRSRFIPLMEVDNNAILQAKKSIRSYLAPVVARALRVKKRDYSIHTCVAHTVNYDVVVTGIVLVDEDIEI